MFDKNSFVKGQLATFTYNDKLRQGVVETVADTFVRLEFMREVYPDGPVEQAYKSFRYEKIRP